MTCLFLFLFEIMQTLEIDEDTNFKSD